MAGLGGGADASFFFLGRASSAAAEPCIPGHGGTPAQPRRRSSIQSEGPSAALYRLAIDAYAVNLMSETATLSSKFQIAVPKRVRDREGWRAGQKLAFLRTPGGVVLVAVPEARDLGGLAEGADPTGYRDRADRY